MKTIQSVVMALALSTVAFAPNWAQANCGKEDHKCAGDCAHHEGAKCDCENDGSCGTESCGHNKKPAKEREEKEPSEKT